MTRRSRGRPLLARSLLFASSLASTLLGTAGTAVADTAAEVPEPGVLWLVALGAGLAGLVRWFGRRK